MKGIERRHHQRVALNVAGTIQFSKGPQVNTEVIEISEGGLRCTFSQPVSLGAAAEVRFILPVATGKVCVVGGRVQHHHQHNDSYMLGVEFTRASAELVQAIRDFVRQNQDAREPQK